MNQNKKVAICIILISFVQMATNGISSILVDIQNYFDGVSVFSIQFLMTFPSLFIILFTIASAYLLKYLSKKVLIQIGLTLICLAGGISVIGYSSLKILFLGAAFLGAGVGLCASFAISLISDYFEPSKRSKLVGIQTAAANFGSMLMTFLGGLLAIYGWKYNYIVYFIALPGLIASHFWLDGKRNIDVQNTSVLNCRYSFKICLIIILFMFLFYIGPTSISLLLAEKGIINSSLSGLGATIFLLGGTLISLVFDKINNLFDKKSILYGYLMLGIGLVLMSLTNELVIIYLGCFMAGASISFVMPECMLLISSNEKSENISIATALAMASSNIGTLIAPLFTVICSNFLLINGTSQRMLVAFICCLLIFLIGSLFMKKGRKK